MQTTKEQIDAILNVSRTNAVSNEQLEYALFNLKVSITELTEAVNKIEELAQNMKEAS
jgi:predicted transcriptional regulator|tara:strand:- start:102 stop:275 length:174 start_codon:yes stop_codon:yes gene_type:complete